MKSLNKYSIIINFTGGWLVFLNVLGIIVDKSASNAYIGLVVLIPVIIMLNIANYCFNNYIEPQKTINDFLITLETNGENKS